MKAPAPATTQGLAWAPDGRSAVGASNGRPYRLDATAKVDPATGKPLLRRTWL